MQHTASKHTDPNSAPLPFRDKLIHGLYAGYSFNISWVIFSYYLVYFYTDVVGLDPAVAGTILLAARGVDCATDLALGYLMDNVCFRFGRYRSWVIFGAAPLFLFFIGVFTALPTENMTLKIAWAALCYGCFGSVAATMSFMPAVPQMVNMTKNPRERESLAVLKGFFYNFAQILAASVFLPLVSFFENGSRRLDLPGNAASPGRPGLPGNAAGCERLGFLGASVVVAFSALLFQLLNIAISRKYELNPDGSIREHLRSVSHEPILSQLRSVFSNRPAVILMGGQVVMQAMCAVRNGALIYVFKYYLGLEDFYAAAMLANTAGMLAGVLLIKPFVRLFRDTGRAYLASMLLSAGSCIAMFAACRLPGPEAAAASMRGDPLFALLVANGVLTGAYLAFIQLMIPDTVDYGQWKNGNGQAGLISALNGFSITVGAALGGQAFGLLLDRSGYMANEAQSAATLNRLLLIAFLVPAAMTALHFVIQCFYGLTDRLLASIR